MEVPALIPARGGSKGVPRKNVKLIGGHPLIAYSIAACKMSNKISDVYVSTDDREIASVALKYGAKVPFLRPLQYASDTSGDWEVINHFFENIDAKYVAYMRPTTPLREPKKIDIALDSSKSSRVIRITQICLDRCSQRHITQMDTLTLPREAM